MKLLKVYALHYETLIPQLTKHYFQMTMDDKYCFVIYSLVTFALSG